MGSAYTCHVRGGGGSSRVNNTPLHVHPVATIRRVVKDDVAAPRRHVLWMEGGVRARPAVRRYVIVWVREDVQDRTVLGAVGAVFPRLIAFARTVRAAFSHASLAHRLGRRNSSKTYAEVQMTVGLILETKAGRRGST